MSEEVITQEENERIIREVRWPDLHGDPEIDETIIADVKRLIEAQMVGREDGSS